MFFEVLSCVGHPAALHTKQKLLTSHRGRYKASKRKRRRSPCLRERSLWWELLEKRGRVKLAASAAAAFLSPFCFEREKYESVGSSQLLFQLGVMTKVGKPHFQKQTFFSQGN